MKDHELWEMLLKMAERLASIETKLDLIDTTGEKGMALKSAIAASMVSVLLTGALSHVWISTKPVKQALISERLES